MTTQRELKEKDDQIVKYFQEIDQLKNLLAQKTDELIKFKKDVIRVQASDLRRKYEAGEFQIKIGDRYILCGNCDLAGKLPLVKILNFEPHGKTKKTTKISAGSVNGLVNLEVIEGEENGRRCSHDLYYTDNDNDFLFSEKR